MKYVVTWTAEYERDGSTEDVASEAWGDLENATKYGDGATIITVEYGNTKDVVCMEDHDPEIISTFKLFHDLVTGAPVWKKEEE